ncbi:MAG: hypothetical protein A3A08_02130 [Candidatus Nealsonbacteria bacterium RIFCSPLOWO2_01_FULL_41_9]|uniref:HD domain-containing protein n=1 Tax=Candidatus Nealsonbacteria bacterium RIFCSPLOWO2_01_FULL_41_9 TaxID=1801671 RepID=A0A1G2EDE9_9BACT|nr:MAG: hypothetical protein A3A08_02130 [Candidatus Nealsonbacteria bacterium RIFCSPLOWO2_01_FULL_41_9]
MEEFDFSSAREKLMDEANALAAKWRKNPTDFEGKPTITPLEMRSIRNKLAEKFLADGSYDFLRRKGFLPKDVRNARSIILALQPIEEEVIPDPKRRPWNSSCQEHADQVGILARLFAEQLQPKNTDWQNKLEIEGLVHDIGRYASHHPWIHGTEGAQLLSFLNFKKDFEHVAYYHLEAGAPILGATPDNWEAILNAPNIMAEIARTDLSLIIIALADMAKKSVEEPAGSGKFVNWFADPMEGVFVSGLRRLTKPQKLAVRNINPADIQSKEQLLEIYRVDKQMGTYLGLCFMFKQYLIKGYGVDFKRILDNARTCWQEMTSGSIL